MPKPSLRSRSIRRVKRTTPAGKKKILYSRRKDGQAKCAICKKPLSGTMKGSKAKVRNLPKTKKRPERPYGGRLCSSCTRKEIKNRRLKDFNY